MGLIGRFDADTGTQHQKAYMKVAVTNINYLQNIASVGVLIFDSRKARRENKTPVGVKNYTFNISTKVKDNVGKEVDKEITTDSFTPIFGGGNTIKKIYHHIKREREFHQWKDVLETEAEV